MLSAFIALYQPTVLKKRYVPKLKKFCLRRVIHRRVCHQKLSWGMPGKFDTKIIINVEPVQCNLQQTRWKWNLKKDLRIQCKSHAEVEQEEDNRTRLSTRLAHQVMHHPNKGALIADSQNNPPYNRISEESKQMINTLGNVECFELCDISPKIQCLCCLKHWTEEIVYCTSGTCLVPTKFTRKKKRKRFDALTIPNIVIKKGGSHGARHGKSEQREYHQAKQCLSKARKKIDSIFQCFQQCETYKNSQMRRGWDEDLCKRSDRVAQEDHSYIATWEERQRYEKGWKLCWETQGPVGPMQSRPDYPEAVRRFREIIREAEEVGYDINPAIRPRLQVRQRPGQQFQYSGKPDAWTVDPVTGWVWRSSSESSSWTAWWRWPSPTSWWSSTDWKEYWAQLDVLKVFAHWQ